MHITAVIPTYNAADYLPTCIAALRSAGFADRSILVVDDTSRDTTADLAEALGVGLIRSPQNRGAAAARNAGAAADPDCDILFFVDADVEVAPDARAVLTTFFKENQDFAAIFGAYDDDPAAPQAISRARNLLHRFVHLESAGDVASFWTGCGAVRRAPFEDVGGFNTDLNMMEDIDLGMRLAGAGHRIKLDPGLQGKHHKRWTLWGMFRTDLFDRAIPWARLIAASGRTPERMLNVSNRSVWSVGLVGLAGLGLLAAPFAPLAGLVVAGCALSAMIVVNGSYLLFLWKLDGTRALPAAVCMLVVHYLCGGLGFAWVRLGLDRPKTGDH